MNTRQIARLFPPRAIVAVVLLATAGIAVGAVSRGRWLPYWEKLHLAVGHVSGGAADDDHSDCDHAGDALAECDDAHAECDQAGDAHSDGAECDSVECGRDECDDTAAQPTDAHDDSVECDFANEERVASFYLSEKGKRNISLRMGVVRRRDFDRTITVPAVVTERPGRTRVMVSAPMTGMVTRIHPIGGEAVSPGDPIVDLRMTHEDLVATQSEFLRTVEELDVIRREVARLEKVTSSGAIAGKALLERKYEFQKTEAALHSQRQALILHGLTEQQVDDIATTRKLLQTVTVFAPRPPEESAAEGSQCLLQVGRIEVDQGQQLNAGDPLCMLSDHSELYLEGRAFAEDSQLLHQVVSRGTPISAVVEGNAEGSVSISDLKILYVEDEIERDSRALKFFLRLPNEMVRNETTPQKHRFIGWRYKPGQRAELLIPVERWPRRIVLPRDAVVGEGTDWFVIQQDGDHYDRRLVHVEYKDRHWAVIGDDGTLNEGDEVVVAGAYQIYQAIKNQGGEATGDEHVGCTH